MLHGLRYTAVRGASAVQSVGQASLLVFLCQSKSPGRLWAMGLWGRGGIALGSSAWILSYAGCAERCEHAC